MWIKTLEQGKTYDVIKLKIANTRNGKKIVCELADCQFFFPDKMNSSVYDDIDKVVKISTNALKIRYDGMENGCHIIDMYYDLLSQWEHMAEYGAI